MKNFNYISIILINFFVVLYVLFFSIFNVNIENYYSYFLIGISIAVYIILFSYIVKNKAINLSMLHFLVVTVLLFIFYLASNNNDYATYTMSFYFLLSAPAAISGIILARKSSIDLEKFFSVIFYFISITFILFFAVSRTAVISADIYSFTNHQQISYIASFAVGLGLFKLSKSDSNNIIILLLISINVIFALASGGRGGMVLIIFYVIFFILTNLHLVKKIFKISLITILAYSLITYLLSKFGVEVLNDRTFSYISNGSIDITETSGREFIYDIAVDSIYDKALFGYGFFNYYSLFGGVPPHNIILESLLIGGIFGAVIFGLLIIWLLLKLYFKIKNNNMSHIIVYILCYPLVMLMFSGNFLLISELWFSIYYILSYKEVNYD